MTETDDPNADADSRLQSIPWWRIANFAGLVLLIAVVVPFVVFMFPQVVGASHSYVVLSDSMEPAMSAGDAIIVNSVAASNIEKGDVITFGGGGEDRPTTHRVIEVVEQDGTTAFRTKGDANEDPDSGLVTPDQVQGRVMSAGGYLFVIPYIGYVINYADTQLGFILLFAVPVTLLVLNEIWNVIVASRADTDGGDEAGSGSTAAEPATSDTADSDADAVDSDADAADGGAEAVETEAAAAGVETESAESSDGGITFTAAELQLGLLVLAAFLAYSVWVAYETLEIWSFGVAGGVASAFLLLAGLYLFGGGSGDATDEGASDAPEPGTEPDADSGADSTGTPEPAASADAESEAPTPAESPAVDPDVELNLLEDIVGQTTDDESTTTAADGSEQHLSDGGTTPTDDDNQGVPGSENPDRTASATGGPEGGETSE
jgi:signal peptidase